MAPRIIFSVSETRIRIAGRPTSSYSSSLSEADKAERSFTMSPDSCQSPT